MDHNVCHGRRIFGSIQGRDFTHTAQLLSRKSNATAELENLGRRLRTWQLGRHLVHFAVPISSEHHFPEIMDNGLPRPNTQTMTFTVGRLYVHVVSSVTDIFENWRLTRSDLLAQIWPIQRNIVVWPLNTMIDRDADQIAAAFHRMSDEVARRDNGRF
jgi:hypothetical protein